MGVFLLSTIRYFNLRVGATSQCVGLYAPAFHPRYFEVFCSHACILQRTDNMNYKVTSHPFSKWNKVYIYGKLQIKVNKNLTLPFCARRIRKVAFKINKNLILKTARFEFGTLWITLSIFIYVSQFYL